MSKRKTDFVVNTRIRLPKRPPREFREITFDRKKIRESIEFFRFHEVARFAGSSYVAIQDEMIRRGCHLLPDILERTMQMEQTLVDTLMIRERITSPKNSALFYQIIETLQKAELEATRTKTFAYKSYFLQYFQALLILEPYKDKFSYFLQTLLEVAVKLCEKLKGRENDSAEIITRIYCKYTDYLQSIGDVFGAIDYLEKALSLAKPHSWLYNDKVKPGMTLHAFVGIDLVNLLLKQSTDIFRQNEKKAISLTQKATLVAIEIGRQNHMALFCSTYLTQALIFIDQEKYSCANRVLDKIRKEIIEHPGYSLSPENIKFYLYQGRVLKAFDNTSKAVTSLQEALRLSRMHNQKFLEAETLMSLGKVFATDRRSIPKARQYFEKAKQTFLNSDDKNNFKKAIYLLAQLKAVEIMPKYAYLLNRGDTQYCAFYKLRQWKNCLLPFWLDWENHLEKQKLDPLFCLLDEEKLIGAEQRVEPQYSLFDEDLLTKRKRQSVESIITS